MRLVHIRATGTVSDTDSGTRLSHTATSLGIATWREPRSHDDNEAGRRARSGGGHV